MAGRVLLVDDEKEFTDVLAQRMETRGVSVDVAANGAEALEMVKSTKYDAVIVDLMMPGIDGVETCRRMLDDNPDLQIIMLSGQASFEKGIEAMKSGAIDFLEKPADIQQIMERIRVAQDKHMTLVEKKSQEQIDNILKSKGW
jgi:DNA-binding response OmpR family regulator